MYKKVKISESVLEELVRKHADKIEEGLVYVGHQQHTKAGGRLDVLLVDCGKSLVVAELKVVEDDGMLLQALDYYDFVSTRVEELARHYTEFGIDPTQPVRLLLIAPSFSPAMMNRLKWIKLQKPPSIVAFQCLELEGKLLPVFNEQSIPIQPEALEIPTQEKIFAYLTDANMRSNVTALLNEIESWKQGCILLDPIKGAISLKVSNRLFAYCYPCRKHFVLECYNSEDVWSVYPVRDDDDLQKVKPIVRASMERRALNYSL